LCAIADAEEGRARRRIIAKRSCLRFWSTTREAEFHQNTKAGMKSQDRLQCEAIGKKSAGRKRREGKYKGRRVG